MVIAPDAKILACRVFQPEFESLGVPAGQTIFLDQGLHRYPDKLRESLGQELRELEKDPAVGQVILGYGYCGGGLEGLTSRRVDLVLPLAHDCIPLLLGGGAWPPLVEQGGSFYLSQGWIDYGQTPLSEYLVTARKYGHEEALWVGRQMLREYREVVLIETLAGLRQRHRRYAKDLAGLFELACRQVQGHPGWLGRLLTRRAGGDVTLLSPRSPVHRGLFPRCQGPGGFLGRG